MNNEAEAVSLSRLDMLNSMPQDAMTTLLFYVEAEISFLRRSNDADLDLVKTTRLRGKLHHLKAMQTHLQKLLNTG